MQHYTYRLECSGQSYIGVRSCGGSPKDDTDYLGSSNYTPEGDVTKCILAVFPTREDAVSHEVSLHEFYDVAVNPSFWNRAKQTSTGFDRAGLTKETCESVARQSAIIKHMNENPSEQRLLGRAIRSDKMTGRTKDNHTGIAEQSSKMKICQNRPWKSHRISNRKDMLSLWLNLPSVFDWVHNPDTGKGGESCAKYFGYSYSQTWRNMVLYCRKSSDPRLDKEYIAFQKENLCNGERM